MTAPLVSVVLPTKNRARTVGAAVRSVLGQTHSRLELIVVDDGSTDDTRAVLEALGDARLRILPLPESRGASGARNAGIAAAQGEWIAFQDSDDLWLPEKLRKQVECAAAHPDGVAVYTSYWRDDGATRVALPRPGPGLDGDVLPRLARGNFITTQTLMVRADVARRLGGFDLAFSALNDWEYALRLAPLGPIHWVPEPLVEYHLQPDSLTKSPGRFIRNYARLIKKHRALLAPDARAEAWHWATMGNRLCREGHRGWGREVLGRAWRLRPLDPRYAGAWLLSWLPARIFRILTQAYGKFHS